MALRFRCSALVLGAVVALGFARDAGAGTIVGKVEARSPERAGGAAAGSDGSYGNRRYKFLERIDYDALRDFVVSIDRVSQPAPAKSPPRAVVSQRDGVFLPHVLPIVVGSEVEWANLDDIFHNVFSISDACGFDLGLYKRGDGAKTVRFEVPGRVDVFCSIHTKMSCVVLVLPNPWFARSDDRGRYVIKDVPAGTYRLKAWHERLPVQIKEVVVPEVGEVRIDFTLGLGQQP